MGLSPRLACCLTLAALALAACDRTPPGPDLGRLYRVGTQFADITPVILVPGLFGSKLRDRTTGVEVWPGTARMLLFDNYRQLALDFDRTTLAVRPDNLEAFDIADAALGQDFYGKIIATLRDFGGYVPGVVGVPPQPGERRYYLFPYDWRQDNVESARGLDRLIEAIRRDYGDPTLRVDIVAHSMGGLVARYYQRYGTEDVLDGRESQVTLYGTSRVRKLILLGTPNMGSASSLHAFLIGEAIGFGRIPQEALATLPSGYELFPHPLVTWLIDVSGHVRHDDLFDGKPGAAIAGRFSIRRWKRASEPRTELMRTRTWPRLAASSTTASNARAVSCGRCRRRSPRRKSATCSSAATAI